MASEYTLRVYRGGSHPSGQDVITDAAASTVLCVQRQDLGVG